MSGNRPKKYIDPFDRSQDPRATMSPEQLRTFASQQGGSGRREQKAPSPKRSSQEFSKEAHQQDILIKAPIKAPEESKAVNPSSIEDVEKMSLKDLQDFVSKNAEINQDAFGDDFDALAAHIGIVESAQNRLNGMLEDKQVAEAIAATEEEARNREEYEAMQVVNERMATIQLQIGDFNARCMQALQDAKECYPPSFFGNNEAFRKQQARIITMVDDAVQSSPSLAEQEKPLNVQPFLDFITEQKDAVTRKR